MKRFVVFIAFVFLLPCASFAKTKCRPTGLPPNPTADDIMKNWFDIKYTRYCNDVYYPDIIVAMLDKGGYKRIKKAVRKRIILHGKRGFDYKDLVAITAPEYTKGLAVLTWSYMDINRQNDIWLWLPSWKKIRKISQADEDDSFLGTEFTVEEISTRKFGYETYRLLGKKVFQGYRSFYDGKVFSEGVSCYIIEAVPKKRNWYYTKRIVWVDEKTGAAIFDEYYDRRGRRFKIIYRHYFYMKNGCFTTDRWEVHNFITGHSDAIIMPVAVFDKGLREKLFSPRVLERQEW